jgi:molybdenum-dependent DNA-binding transcriptional regulator ModE
LAEADRTSDLRPHLRPRQALLLAGLMAGKGIEAAAKEAGISARTAYRYAADDAFKRALRESQRELTLWVVARAHGIGDEAIRTLEAIASDATAPASARVAAARHLDARRWRALEHGSLRAEVDEVRERLESKERELALTHE